MSRRRRLVLLDDGPGGHRPYYFRCLARHWLERPGDVELAIATTAEFCDRHAGLVAELRDWGVMVHRNVELGPRAGRPGLPGYDPRAPDLWRAARRCVQETACDHMVLMNIDGLLPWLALRRPRLGCSFSGIYFRPASHYRALFGQAPPRAPPFRAFAERMVLRRVLQYPELTRLLSLDPFAAAYFSSRGSGRLSWLPDPVPDVKPRPPPDDGRTTLLLFGSTTHRKGALLALEALNRLSPLRCGSLRLLLLGVVPDAQRAALLWGVEALRARGLVVEHQDRFVPEQVVLQAFHRAHIVLLPYQQHVGSSGVLLRAAAHARPVLAAEYGLVGAWTRLHRLGRTVNAADPDALARVLSGMLDGETGFSLSSASRFIAEFAEARFAAGVLGSCREPCGLSPPA
jgi:glycosyltransferase involved in cell wall biosynthesis